jgi:hypothetical protein
MLTLLPEVTIADTEGGKVRTPRELSPTYTSKFTGLEMIPRLIEISPVSVGSVEITYHCFAKLLTVADIK